MKISRETYIEAYKKMYCVRKLSEVIDKNTKAQQFVHSFPSGHEAIQTAAGLLLEPSDHLFPYYRDTCLIHAAGFDLRAQLEQLFSVKGEAFSGSTSYFNHISYRGDDHPNVILQSAATGMQAIPAVSLAQGLQYLNNQNLNEEKPQLVLCSMGEGALSSGEVSEAVQMAVFMKLPVVFLVQDNDWIISANKKETVSKVTPDFYRRADGLDYTKIKGWKFDDCYSKLSTVYQRCRQHSRPAMVYVQIRLLGHHTSKVKKLSYRRTDELNEQYSNYDPLTILEDSMIKQFKNLKLKQLRDEWNDEIYSIVKSVGKMDAMCTDLPAVYKEDKGNVGVEAGQRKPAVAREVYMAEAATSALDEIMAEHPEAIYLGQDIGEKLGGVFRESFGLAAKFGKDRVINMSIQEAYIVGSCSGLAAAGCKPIVFVQFADYAMLGINQLFTEISKSFFLTGGTWPIQCLIRIPVGHYKGAGPYHAATIESILLNVRGVKVIYPSNAADMKGLLKTAFNDPNPVISLEHKGLYWSGNPDTDSAKNPLPDSEYRIPLGKANIVQQANASNIDQGRSAVVITYGMGVHWALAASAQLNGQVEIVDLRSLEPLDMDCVRERVKLHNKCLVLTEEMTSASFAASLAASIQEDLFQYLDAPVMVVGSLPVPAIPINPSMEDMILPNPEKVKQKLEELLGF